MNEQSGCEGYPIRLSLEGSLVPVVMLGTVLESAIVCGEKSGSKESKKDIGARALNGS